MSGCRMGEPRPKTAAEKGGAMKRILLLAALAAFGALVFASIASAQTVPTVDVGAYGDTLLSSLGNAITSVWPYAAAVTGVAIIVALVKRMLGSRKATQVG